MTENDHWERSDDDLLRLLADELVPEIPPIDPLRVEAVRAAAIESRPDRSESAPVSLESKRRRAFAVVGMAAALLVLVALLGVAALTRGGDDGVLEFAGSAEAVDGQVIGDISVRRTGIGRVIELDTNELPILPKGEYYEVWFVGPNETPERLDRISAGTFHPDDEGRSEVTFAAAVDPALYPIIVITAEPGDGNPAPNGPVVAVVMITLDG